MTINELTRMLSPMLMISLVNKRDDRYYERWRGEAGNEYLHKLLGNREIKDFDMSKHPVRIYI